MRCPMWLLVLLAALMLALYGCAASRPPDAPTAAPASQPVLSASPSPSRVPSTSPSPESSPPADDVADRVVRAAAAHLGVAATAVRVDSVDAREWPDSSLGCPSPGMLYAQVVTAGYVVVVSGAGKQLEYHIAPRGQPVLCQER